VPVTPTTHVTLLQRLARPGDAAAWREFHERYGELILNVARRQGLQPADADDTLQEVLVGLTKSLPGFEYDPARGKFRSYLRTCVMRTVFRRLRQKYAESAQQSLEAAGADPPADDGVEALWEQEWRQYHLRQALRTLEGELNTRHRLAFEAHVLDQRDARETAELFELTTEALYQIKSRVLRRLTELIDAQICDEG
jgi:RNA polymerase sigma-70 factor (ECF subfamily)